MFLDMSEQATERRSTAAFGTSRQFPKPRIYVGIGWKADIIGQLLSAETVAIYPDRTSVGPSLTSPKAAT